MTYINAAPFIVQKETNRETGNSYFSSIWLGSSRSIKSYSVPRLALKAAFRGYYNDCRTGKEPDNLKPRTRKFAFEKTYPPLTIEPVGEKDLEDFVKVYYEMLPGIKEIRSSEISGTQPCRQLLNDFQEYVNTL